MSAETNPLTRKLAHFAPLSAVDRKALDDLAAADVKYPADVDIAAEGTTPGPVFLLKQGMAMRYRMLRDGGRQIVAILLPGDLCNLQAFVLRAMDHSIGTLTAVQVAPISRESWMEALAAHPRISSALWWSALQEEAMMRERIVSLGRRNAEGRIAYLFCEMLWRQTAVGLTQTQTVRLPLTQIEIGDMLGLTAVHVSRVLKVFRTRGLILIRDGLLELLNVAELQEIAGFTSEYLHLGGASDEAVRYLNQIGMSR